MITAQTDGLQEHLPAAVPGGKHRAREGSVVAVGQPRGADGAVGRMHGTQLALTAALRDWARRPVVTLNDTV